MLSDMNIKRVDSEKKRKAIFYLSSKGKDLSTAVREMLEKYAKEFDKMQKITSMICHQIKSFLLFLITETAMQVADNKEKRFPMIK